MTTRQNDETGKTFRLTSNVTLCCQQCLSISKFASILQAFFSHILYERRSAVFYHLSNTECATDTRKMMKISNAVGKIEILHMINGRIGKNIESKKKILVWNKWQWDDQTDSGSGTLSFRTPLPVTVKTTRKLYDTIAKYAHFVALMKRFTIVANFFFLLRIKKTTNMRQHETRWK